MKAEKQWAIADRISDRIVEIINDELHRMRTRDKIEPLQLIAGQLLAFCALERTMPPPGLRPAALQVCMDSIKVCLDVIINERNK
jgi:hypothetical protein